MVTKVNDAREVLNGELKSGRENVKVIRKALKKYRDQYNKQRHTKRKNVSELRTMKEKFERAEEKASEEVKQMEKFQDTLIDVKEKMSQKTASPTVVNNLLKRVNTEKKEINAMLRRAKKRRETEFDDTGLEKSSRVEEGGKVRRRKGTQGKGFTSPPTLAHWTGINKHAIAMQGCGLKNKSPARVIIENTSPIILNQVIKSMINEDIYRKRRIAHDVS